MALIAPLADPREVTRGVAERVRPPRRMRPSEAAAKWMANDRDQWAPEMAPMMVEPLDALGGREYQGICLVGPQRSSKTFGLILGGMTYAVTCAPGPMMIVQMTEAAARDFSRNDLEQTISNSPEVRGRLSKRARDDNVHDKWFRSGMLLKISWPAVSQLTSRTFRYMLLTDYDQVENHDNIGGRGPLWDFAFKRVQTYMSRGKLLAESFPGCDFVDREWRPRSPHEAPPARGILGYYNQGTRGRWFWPCQHCGEYFQARPGYDAFLVPEVEEVLRALTTRDVEALVEEYARVPCPHCGAVHEPADKARMNPDGIWVHEGQSIRKGQLVGDRRPTNIWSGWFGGVAASYQTWPGIVRNWLQAIQNYARTGDEAQMRMVTNSDSCAPYVPRARANSRKATDYDDRKEPMDRGKVPEGVRFLLGLVDVQKRGWVVQIYGYGEGLECWPVDRFEITKSKRRDAEGDPEPAQPGVYLEDWELVRDQVIGASYPLADGSGRRMSIKATICDSAGEDGVTDKAYSFWRSLRKEGLEHRLFLMKGATTDKAPRVKQTFPDASGRKDRKAQARGEIPVWQINVQLLKDSVDRDLSEPDSTRRYHFPDWLPDEFFDELTAEYKDERKGWVRRNRNQPNEAWDLTVYGRALTIILGAEKIDWVSPPAWARTWDHNTLVVAGDPEKPVIERMRKPRRRGARVLNRGIA